MENFIFCAVEVGSRSVNLIYVTFMFIFLLSNTLIHSKNSDSELCKTYKELFEKMVNSFQALTNISKALPPVIDWALYSNN